MSERPPRLIAFAGSLRAESTNKKLVRNLAAGAEAAGAEVRVLDLKDYPLPVYDADLYDAAAADPHALHDRGGRVGGPHGIPMPEGLLALKEHVRWSDGWLIATPEYNRSYPGMLKNLFDWLTRMAPGESPLDNFTYKIVGIVCAAYEGGGVSAAADLRRMLSGLACIVVPGSEVFVIEDDLFDEAGRIRDTRLRKTAEAAGERVVRMVRRLNPETQG